MREVSYGAKGKGKRGAIPEGKQGPKRDNLGVKREKRAR